MKNLARSTVLALVALLAPLAGAQSSSVELLANPGAEQGLSGWSDPLGNGFQAVHYSTLSYVGVIEGNYAFWAGNSGPGGPLDHELRQEVDLSAHAAEIDAGGVYWFLSTNIYSREFGGVQSSGRVTIEVLDGAGAMLDSYTTPFPIFFGAYIPFRNSRAVPPGARGLRFRMLAHRTGGNVTDVLFDLQSLQLFFPPQVYCTAKPNSLGCLPAIGFGGWPDTFRISATNVRNNQFGIFFWGRGSNAVPFLGGTLCVQGPFVRTAVQGSGGSPQGDDCSGSYSFDFTSNYAISSGAGPGETLFGQFWSRDPGFSAPDNVGLTDAVQWVVDY